MPHALRTRRIALLLSMMFLSACQDVDSYSGHLIFSGEHSFDRELAVDGDLIILDGKVDIAPGSRITGSVYMLGGDLLQQGAVEGDITILDGSLQLRPGAILLGDLNMGSNQVSVHPGSQVLGDVVEGFALPTEWVRREPTFGEQLRSSLFQLVVMILLAMLLKRYLLRPLSRIKLAITKHLLLSVTVGILSAVIGLVLFIQLAFTIILIPVSIAGLGFMFLLVVIGWIAIGAWLSEQIQTLPFVSLPEWALLIISVGIISVLIDAVPYIPVIGTPIVLVSASAGIGAALLTRFGFQSYKPAVDLEVL